MGARLRRATEAAFLLLMTSLVVVLPAPADASSPVCDPLDLGSVHTGGAISGQLQCADGDDDPLSFSVTDPPAGFATVDSAGFVTYVAPADYVGPDTFTVLVDDNAGSTTSATVQVAVVNHAPGCGALATTTAHDSTAFVAVDCVDPDGDDLTHTVVDPPAHGEAEIQFGVLTYTPSPGFVGVDSLSYRANDGVEHSVPAEVVITVTDAAPECGDASPTTLRTGKAQTIVVPCLDPDDGWDSLRGEVVTGPSHGDVLEVATDAYSFGIGATYEPAPGYVGADRFVLAVADGHESTEVPVTVTVTRNHAPECEDSLLATKVGDPVRVYLSCVDPDVQDETLTTEVVAGPQHGVLQPSDVSGQFTYVPDAGFQGTDEFRLVANDGDLADTSRVQVNVADTPWCAAPEPVAVRPGTSRDLQPSCTVPPDDFSTHNLSVVTPPTKGAVTSPFGGALRYTAPADATGADSFSYRLASSAGSSPPATQDVSIGPDANRPPTCVAADAAAYAGRTTTLFPFCSDPDVDPISYTVDLQPEHGTSSSQGGSIDYTADADHLGDDEVPFTAADGHGGATDGTIHVVVAAPERPTCGGAPITRTVRPGAAVDLAVVCTNPQGDPQTYTIAQQPEHGEVSLNEATGSLRYQAAPGGAGSDSFTIRASNDVGAVDVIVEITLDPDFNRAPTCGPNAFDQRRVESGKTVELDLSSVCTDPDGDPLVFTVNSQPSHGTLTTGPSATLTYTPEDGFLGHDSFMFKATDDRGLSSAVTPHYLEVIEDLSPSCAARPAITVPRNQEAQVLFDCSTPDNSVVTYRVVTPPTLGSLTPSGETTSPFRTYTAGSVAGTDSFTYQAVSSSGTSPLYTQAVVVVRPDGDNQPPICETPEQPLPVPGDVTTVLPLDDLCTDPDGDPLTYEVAEPQPAHGLAEAVAGVVRYTPDQGWTGSDAVAFTASDGFGGATNGTATLDVQDVAPPKVSLQISSGQSPRDVARTGLRLAVTLDEPAKTKSTTSVSRATAKKLGLGPKSLVLGRTTQLMDAGRTKVRISLSAKASRALRNAKRVPMVVTVTATDPAGHKTAITKRVTLR